jgi:hypothetical protein
MEQKDQAEFQPVEVDRGLMEIVDYLRELQPGYDEELSEWRGQVGKANRGCGLGAYILARSVHSEKPHLPLDGSLGPNIDSSEGVHLIFGLQKEKGRQIDHAWVEVVLGGQVLLISPESEFWTNRASFRATIFNLKRLREVYERIGLRRLQTSENEATLPVSKKALTQVEEIVDEINHGRTPEVYKEWYERFLTRLK